MVSKPLPIPLLLVCNSLIIKHDLIRATNVKQQKRKKEEISVSASLANSAAQDKRNSQQGSHYNSHTESTDNEHDFTIHSAEEARRAIIWGEILQRKY